MQAISILIAIMALSSTIQPTYVNCAETTKKIFSYESVDGKHAQDAFVEENTLYKFWNDNYMQEYTFPDGVLKKETEIEGGHCSVATSDGEYAYIETNNETLVVNSLDGTYKEERTFAEGGGYYVKRAVDANGIIYGAGCKNKDRRTPENNNKTIISKWSGNQIEEKFEIPFVPFIQGMCIEDKSLFLLSSDYLDPETKIYEIDLEKKKIKKIYHNFPRVIKNNECEAVFVFEGRLFTDTKDAIYQVAELEY